MATSTPTRLTKRDKFETLLSYFTENPMSFVVTKGETELDFSDVTDFLANEIELLAKKNAAERKPDVKKIAADAALMAEIADVLSRTGKTTISELMKNSETLHDLSNQKMAYLLNKMEADGRVVKSVEKRKAYFELVEG